MLSQEIEESDIKDHVFIGFLQCLIPIGPIVVLLVCSIQPFLDLLGWPILPGYLIFVPDPDDLL